MSTKISLRYTLFIALVGVGLLATACASPTTVPSPVVAQPTQAPAQPAATALPALPETTATPMVAPTTPAQPTPTALPTSAETAFNIGTAQTINGISIFPEKIQYQAAYGSNQPKAGDQFAVITFSIVNTSKTDSFNLDPAKIVVLNPDGTTVSMATLTAATDVLAAQTLKPGAKAQGVIVYDVPQNVSKWLLEFEGANNHNLLWSLG